MRNYFFNTFFQFFSFFYFFLFFILQNFILKNGALLTLAPYMTVGAAAVQSDGTLYFAGIFNSVCPRKERERERQRGREMEINKKKKFFLFLIVCIMQANFYCKYLLMGNFSCYPFGSSGEYPSKNNNNNNNKIKKS